MPFKSEAQRGYMFAKHPEIAKRFAAETPKGAKLPEHVAKKKKRRSLEDKTKERLHKVFGKAR